MPPGSVAEPHDLLTHTDPSRPAASAGEEVLGVLWVFPEERFHALEAGGAIGRSGDCSIRLEGTSLSRQHAVLKRDGPVWMLRDQGSKNGTFVNGQRVGLAALSLQDTVRIGDWVGVVCRLPRAAAAAGHLFEDLMPGATLSASTSAGLLHLSALATRDIPIIIQGESGSGKEVLARAIHHLSGRRGAFVAINCSAIVDGLAEAELFGHRKGAFTGALEPARGHVAAADGGTLLLDEVVELPLGIQSKLLRVLEERAVVPVGATQPVAVDFRLIASAQEPLEALVQAGEFRADLYARLNGAELRLPPLRERRQEVVRLLRQALASELGSAPELERLLVERLCVYDWPYNVREVHQLARLLAVSGQPSYCLADLPQRFRELTPGEPASVAREGSMAPSGLARRKAWLARYVFELDRLKRALVQCEGNLSEAARTAGIPRHRARRLLEAEAALGQKEASQC